MSRAILSTLLIVVTIFTSCAQKKELLINNKAQFDRMSSQPLYQKYGQVQSVKVVYDTKFKKLHVISSSRYQYHYEYCQEILGYFGSLGSFGFLRKFPFFRFNSWLVVGYIKESRVE